MGPMKLLKALISSLFFTDWADYRAPDFDRIKSSLSEPIVIDGRNLYSPEKMRQLGFQYHCIGRPS